MVRTRGYLALADSGSVRQEAGSAIGLERSCGERGEREGSQYQMPLSIYLLPDEVKQWAVSQTERRRVVAYCT